jgi:hypothetical protein
MADQFYDIPIAMTVLDDKVYGVYFGGDLPPYELPVYPPMVATLAIEMGLFNDSQPGEVHGKPVTWWRNKRA